MYFLISQKKISAFSGGKLEAWSPCLQPSPWWSAHLEYQEGSPPVRPALSPQLHMLHFRESLELQKSFPGSLGSSCFSPPHPLGFCWPVACISSPSQTSPTPRSPHDLHLAPLYSQNNLCTYFSLDYHCTDSVYSDFIHPPHHPWNSQQVDNFESLECHSKGLEVNTGMKEELLRTFAKGVILWGEYFSKLWAGLTECRTASIEGRRH